MGKVNELLSEIMAKGPSPATIYIILSRLKEEGQWKRVIQECIKALAVTPDDIPIRRLLAEAYLGSGLLSQAETELKKVTLKIDDLIPAYRLLTEVYARQGRAEEASQAMKIYLAHRPEDGSAQEILKGLITEKEPVKPIPTMEMEEEILPEAGEPAPSMEMEEELLPEGGEEVPEIATPRLAEIYFDQGLLKEAIETYEKVLQRNPEDGHAGMRLEELRAMMAEEEAAVMDPERKRKERMIAALEGWLDNIRAGAVQRI